MGDGMSMRERADMDNYITGGGSPGIADDVLPGPPIVLAWYMLDTRHAPLPREIVEAVNKSIAEDGWDSTTAVALLKNHYEFEDDSNAEQILAREEFSRGWEAGVETDPFDPAAPHDGDWVKAYFNYTLGHIAGDFAASFGWATPYERDHDDDLTSDEENEARDESEKIEVQHLATDQ